MTEDYPTQTGTVTAIDVSQNVAALRNRLMFELANHPDGLYQLERESTVQALASALSLMVYGHNPRMENILREAARLTWGHFCPTEDQARIDFQDYLTGEQIRAVFSDLYVQRELS